MTKHTAPLLPHRTLRNAVLLMTGIGVLLLSGVYFQFVTDSAYHLMPLLALLLSVYGSTTVYRALQRASQRGRERIAGIGLLIGIVVLGTSWIGHWVKVVLFTVHRYGEHGQVIDVINYTLSYVADHYLAWAAFVLLSVGVLMLLPSVAQRYAPPSGPLLAQLVGILVLGSWLLATIELALDNLLVATMSLSLWLLYIAAWIALGYIIQQMWRRRADDDIP